MLNTRELTAQIKAFAAVVSEHVSKAFSSLATRISDLEGQVKAIPHVDSQVVAKEAASLVLQDLPTPKDGENGKDADPELIHQLVAQAVAALPPAKDGADGKSVSEQDLEPLLIRLVDERVKAIPAAKDGESIPIEQVQAMVDEAVAKALAGVQLPKDGAPGRDGAHIEILPAIDEQKSYPRGTFAKHLGGLFRAYETTHEMRGWECIVDGIAAVDIQQVSERKFNAQVVRSGGEVSSHNVYLPVMIYRGLFKPGEFEPGDTVTWGGKLWHCDSHTSDKPGEIGSKGWTLCVKNGRDGKDGKDGKDLVKGVSLK